MIARRERFTLQIETGLRKTRKMADRDEAEKLLHALNESNRNPHLNQRMAHVYLAEATRMP